MVSRGKRQRRCLEGVSNWSLAQSVPGALSQRRQKGLRLEAPLPAPKTQRRACPSVLTFQRRSVPPLSLGTPGTPAPSACTPTPTQPHRNLCYETGSSRCQPSPLALGCLSLGAGEEGSHPHWKGQGRLFRGLPFGPWGPGTPRGPCTGPLQRGRGGGVRGALGCLDLRCCSLRLVPSSAPFLLPNPVFLQTTVPFISSGVRWVLVPQKFSTGPGSRLVASKQPRGA